MSNDAITSIEDGALRQASEETGPGKKLNWIQQIASTELNPRAFFMKSSLIECDGRILSRGLLTRRCGALGAAFVRACRHRDWINSVRLDVE
jgi:hypothetical protein